MRSISDFTAAPRSRSTSTKAEQTTAVAQSIIQEEVTARDKKTARLRKLRLAMAEKEAGTVKAAPARARRAPRKKQAAS
ncbi:hypothetical protein GN330_16965 [Nitratireductor sp. CAU 1489]|uniref:Uncharacterized protein n=1 Tax=Nitratireductor arenosus TaxID=2682096 RepID=A0A844QLW7_9HYPH|nr:hypothetical protein [Nitratireductor arenosus]MVA98940.1 hypothetical protein [Nitratireductor arenosus]